MTETHSAQPSTPPDKTGRADLGRVFSGLAFIGIGLLVWLQLGDGLALIDLATYWPVLLIISGIAGMLSARACSGGWVLAAVGVGFLLYNLGYAPWPVLLVGIGVVMVFRGLREGTRLTDGGNRDA